MFRSSALALILLAATGGTGALAQASTDWAGEAFGGLVRPPSVGGRITADDLVRLRDVGGVSSSPDGRTLAFAVYQAVPETNSYAMKWFVVPIDGSSGPRALDADGGQPISTDIHGLPYAYVYPPYARWSPDGRLLAIRSLVAGRISLWTIDVASGKSTQASEGNADVVAFSWTPSGALIYKTGVDRDKFERSIDTEASRGWLLDKRIQFYSSHLRPPPPNCERTPQEVGCENDVFAVVPNAGVRAATKEEAESLPKPSGYVAPGSGKEIRADGASVSAPAIDPQYTDAINPIRRIGTDIPGAKPCADSVCTGMYIDTFGWARGGRSVWFIRYGSSLGRADGIPRDEIGLFEWVPATGKVRTIYRKASTQLSDCRNFERIIVCKEEASKTPSRVVSIDLETKEVRILADPNPMFSTKDYPSIREITVTDSGGNLGYAYVIYPNDYERGKKYPLVVTQYAARGFMRGQVGNEYPMFPLAARGLVVMSVEWSRFPKIQQTHDVTYWNKFNAASGRELAKSQIDRGIDQLISEGLVDPRRVAITGLSAGAEITHYILQRSNRFAAAIVSSGAWDITSFAQASMDGDRERVMKQYQSSTVIPPLGNVLYNYAWSNKPEKLVTPLLINAGEYEGLVGFEGIAAIQNAGGPLEFRIFPDEQHIKYHPRSILGVYNNNLEWLSFWLQGVEDPDPSLKPQYQRWRAMRAKIDSTKR